MCRKNVESNKPKVENIKKWRTLLSSSCAVCGSKKSIFSRKQGDCSILTGLLVVKSPFEGSPVLGNII